MRFHVVVATHHKSGTNWMGAVFSEIAAELGVPFVHLSRISPVRARQSELDEAPDPSVDPRIYFYAYGRMPKIRRSKWFRGIHVVRDPRDMVLSAASYHTWSEESWLHVPREEFDGLSYQEKINSFEEESDRIAFEMRNNSSKIIGQMVNFDLRDCLFDVRYEDMRRDEDLLSWHRICLQLGFGATELPVCMTAFIRHSLQFGKVGEKAHIQDASITRWQKRFPSSLLAEAEDRFSIAIERYAYN